jgi:hypothetical protein
VPPAAEPGYAGQVRLSMTSPVTLRPLSHTGRRLTTLTQADMDNLTGQARRIVRREPAP